MQKILLIGYRGWDPEVKYSQQGAAIAQFSVASTERSKNRDGEPQEHTEWFAIEAFGRRAEIVGEHLHKGSRIYVEVRSARSLGTTSSRVLSNTRTSCMLTGSNFWIQGATATQKLRAAATTR